MTGFLRILLLLLAATVFMDAWAVEKIRVVGLFKDKVIAVIDGKQQLLKLGETTANGVTLISSDSKQALIEINGKQNSYRLGSQYSTTFAAPAEGEVVRIWPSLHGMYHIRGSINGYPVNFMVDTGATQVALSAEQAKRLGIDYQKQGAVGYAETASGLAKTYSVNLSRIKVGDIELGNIKAVVLDGNYPTTALLGMSFLNRLKIRRDGPVMELRKKY